MLHPWTMHLSAVNIASLLLSRRLNASADVVLMLSSVLQTCQICFEDYTTMDMFAAPCNHLFCR